VTGLDGTRCMHRKAVHRTEKANLSDLVSFHLGDALDLPFSAGRFDIVWGQDTPCYVTDKARLIQECSRVVKPSGIVAFTNRLETGPMAEEEWRSLHAFMVFPYTETLEGYVSLVEHAGLTVEEEEDLSEDFAAHMDIYPQHMREEHRKRIVTAYGEEMYRETLAGIILWRDAAVADKVGRGRVIA
jgi:ubiquinone/menaquinone biosynthesis C-methylase UbiE